MKKKSNLRDLRTIQYGDHFTHDWSPEEVGVVREYSL